VSSSVQRPRAWRYRFGVSWKSIVGGPASVHGWSKAVGVACLESMNWVRVTGAGPVYLSHIGSYAPDRVIWLATLLRSGVRHGIIVDAYRAKTAESGNAVEGAVWTGWRCPIRRDTVAWSWYSVLNDAWNSDIQSERPLQSMMVTSLPPTEPSHNAIYCITHIQSIIARTWGCWCEVALAMAQNRRRLTFPDHLAPEPRRRGTNQSPIRCDITAFASDLRLSASGVEQKDPESEGFNMLKFMIPTDVISPSQSTWQELRRRAIMQKLIFSS
jgi:hypothetical protein